MPIKTIFLDAGGILVNPNWQRVSDILARYGIAVPVEALRTAEPHIKRALDRADLVQATSDQDRFITYLQMIFDRCGCANVAREALEELHAYQAEFNLWESVAPEVYTTLDELRSLGYKLVVVSNSNGTLHRSFTRLGLIEKVDLIFDSHEHGVEKPDPAFFHMALKDSHTSAETTIHVGDFYHIDVVGARAAGIVPILLDEGGLYNDFDCPRISRFDQLVEHVMQLA
jgi:HAD superfamily hydrolase (TIGR01549 family)